MSWVTRYAQKCKKQGKKAHTHTLLFLYLRSEQKYSAFLLNTVFSFMRMTLYTRRKGKKRRVERYILHYNVEKKNETLFSNKGGEGEDEEQKAPIFFEKSHTR